MDLCDILIHPGQNEPSFDYAVSANYFPPKRIVICQDKILRFNKVENQNANIHSSFQIASNNDQIKVTNNDLLIDEPSTIPKLYHHRSNKSAQVSKSAIDERKRIRKRIANFDQRKSQAWKYLTLMYGPQIKHEKLINLAEYAASYLKIYIDRDARRRKCVLIKWFDENWNKIGPLFHPF